MHLKLFLPVLVVLLFWTAPSGVTAEEVGKPQFLASGFSFPEGPALDRQGNLYVVNLQKTIINKISPGGFVSTVIDVGGVCNGAIFDREGNLFIASTGRRAILILDIRGNLAVMTDMCNGDSLLGPNDLAWGSEGRLYFTDPWTSSETNPIGGVHYIDKDGVTRRFAGGLAFPNGIAFDTGMEYCYVGETQRFRILRYKVNPDGSAGNREIFFSMGENVLADGMKFDVKGNLWVANWTTSELWCISPGGEKTMAIPIPGIHPTNLIFGGKDMRTAYVTVFNEGNKDSVYTVRMPYPGVPVPPG